MPKKRSGAENPPLDKCQSRWPLSISPSLLKREATVSLEKERRGRRTTMTALVDFLLRGEEEKTASQSGTQTFPLSTRSKHARIASRILHVPPTVAGGEAGCQKSCDRTFRFGSPFECKSCMFVLCSAAALTKFASDIAINHRRRRPRPWPQLHSLPPLPPSNLYSAKLLRYGM